MLLVRFHFALWDSAPQPVWRWRGEHDKKLPCFFSSSRRLIGRPRGRTRCWVILPAGPAVRIHG